MKVERRRYEMCGRESKRDAMLEVEKNRAWKSFQGQTFLGWEPDCGGLRVEADEIKRFAAEFDPQPFI